jgi:hypothetical protein
MLYGLLVLARPVDLNLALHFELGPSAGSTLAVGGEPQQAAEVDEGGGGVKLLMGGGWGFNTQLQHRMEGLITCLKMPNSEAA